MSTQEISPEAAIWVARRGMVLDYLNEEQPADPGHNKRLAADLTRLMQEWDSLAARVNRATFRERYELQRQVEAVRALAAEMEREDPQISTRHIAMRIRQALGEEAA